MPATMSDPAIVHAIAFCAAFLSLIAVFFVFARRFACMGQRGWRAYCVGTGVVSPVLIVLGISFMSWVGVLFAAAGAVAFGCVSVIAVRLISEAQHQEREEGHERGNRPVFIAPFSPGTEIAKTHSELEGHRLFRSKPHGGRP
jgi:hypothetical protein